ncbi:MAG: molybdenum cofactor guanylyltransferase [bacterium]|nr:molybdenum cofactor guanylyltransferase [bacterium]
MEAQSQNPASAIILAGGKGTRLKRDKTTLIIHGKPILNLIVSRFNRLDFREIILVYGTDPRLSPVPVRQVGDLLPGYGVLGGIFTGLSLSGTDLNFFIACDMPFPQVNLMEYILQLAASQDYDCVVPVNRGYREPLFAVYRKTCLPVIKKQLEAKDLHIAPIFSRLKTREISETELDRFDPRRLSFFNINTPDDLRAAEEISRDPEAAS